MKKIDLVYPEHVNFLNTEDLDDFSYHICIDPSVLKKNPTWLRQYYLLEESPMWLSF